MFSKTKELSKLIDKEIDNLNKQKESKESINNGLIDLYNDIYNNNEKLVYVKEEELKKIANQFVLDNKDSLYTEIISIKKILTMNKDYKSSLRLSNKNKESLNKFLEEFNNLNEYLKNNDPVIIDINNSIDDYNDLKLRIQDDNYKLSSKDLRLYEKVFKNNNSNESRKILIELIDYDNRLFNDSLSKSRKKDTVKVDEKDLVSVFKKHKYNYNDINNTYKSYLINNGNINNIDSIFTALEDNEYPIIDNDYVLVSILLGSNKDTINNITEFAKKNKLIPKSLLDISGVLIKQEETDNSDYGIMVSGSSIDFMRNINTLKEAGISINYIYQCCKSILTMPNNLLEHNLDLFQKYGFSFEYKRKGIIDPSPSALLSIDFAEVADAFIEIHKDGLKYLTDNLSNLKTVSNPKALMFYNIYESNKRSTGNINDPDDGPFRKVMEDDTENYQLKAIITRNRPDYRNTYYMDITEENKEEKTNTVEIELSNKHFLDKIVEENKFETISNNIFNNSFIKAVNKYIDEESPLIYNFNGIRISRLKVLRIFDILLKNSAKNSIENFMYSITYNSILDRESYSIIYNCISKELEEVR